MIFLKARKVGGTSFEIGLSRFATRSSIITPITKEDEDTRRALGFRGPQNYKYNLWELSWREATQALRARERPNKFYNHISARNAKHLLGTNIWEKYTKVSIVRNPFDYVVSSFFWSAAGRRASNVALEFEPWVISRPNLLNVNDDQYKIDGKNIIDFMIRYDNLDHDLRSLEIAVPQLLGFSDLFKMIRAKGKYRPKSATMEAMFSSAPHAYDLVKKAYAEEIEEYGFALP